MIPSLAHSRRTDAANTATAMAATTARRPGTAVRPQLTSLVDMMTILLVFLLKSFSVDGELMTTADDLNLPTSSSTDRAQPEVSVEITRTGLQVDGRPLLDFASLTTGTETPIPALQEELTRRTGNETAGPRAVTIQCDREHDFHVLKRVMTTCSLAGYDDFSLLVLREDT